jgi:hypothetical protein
MTAWKLQDGRSGITSLGWRNEINWGQLQGRSPHTGKEIKIAAKGVPEFSAGAASKAAARKAVPATQKAQKAPARPKKK